MIRLWDVSSRNQFGMLKGPASNVYSVAFSPDGQLLASAAEGERAFQLWEASSGRQVRTFPGNDERYGPVQSVAFSPDGKLLALGQTIVRLLDVSNGQELRAFTGHTNRVYCVVFSPDGKLLASASLDKTVKLWEVASGRELRTLSHTGPLSSVAFSPDGKLLATGAADGTVTVWGVK